MKKPIGNCLKSLLTAMMLVSMSLPAWSEDNKANGLDLNEGELLFTEIPQVVTVSKVAESSKVSPATVYVITAQQIKDRGYLDLKDILFDLPGVDITPNIGGENGGWQVVPRGMLGLNKLQILLDGIPLNPPSGDKFVWGNNISLENVERIEVLFGPASALYGADAMGGVINMITKKGSDIKGNEAKALYGTANTRAGSYLFGQKFQNDVDFVAFGRMFYSDGFNFKHDFPEIYGELNTRDQTGFDTHKLRAFEAPIMDYNAFAKLTYKDITIEISRNHYHENNTRAESLLYYAMNSNAYWEFDTDLVSFKHRLPMSDTVELNSTLSYNRYQVNNNSNYEFYNGDAFKQLEAKSTKLDEQLNVDFSKDIKCVFGLEAAETANLPYSYDLTDSERTDPNQIQNLQNPTWGYVNSDGQTVQFRGTGLLSVRTVGIYAQARYNALDNLSFILGDRFDWNSYYDYRVFDPRASIVYQPTDKATVKLLYGTSFISPSLWANNIFWMSPGYGHVTPDIMGIKLKPETMESYELNFNYEFTPKLVGTLDVYYNKLKDILQGEHFVGNLPIIVNEGDAPVSYGIETAENLGDETVLGADLLIKYQFLPNWEASGSYSYLHGTINNGDTTMDTNKVATHKGILGITGKFLNHFSLYVRERLVGQQTTSPLNEFAGSSVGGNNRIDGYAVTDLNLRIFNYIKDLDFFIRVDNLFDTKYYGVGLEDERYTTAGDWLPRIPFDPRMIQAGATYHF